MLRARKSLQKLKSAAQAGPPCRRSAEAKCRATLGLLSISASCGWDAQAGWLGAGV